MPVTNVLDYANRVIAEELERLAGDTEVRYACKIADLPSCGDDCPYVCTDAGVKGVVSARIPSEDGHECWVHARWAMLMGCVLDEEHLRGLVRDLWTEIAFAHRAHDLRDLDSLDVTSGEEGSGS